MKQLRKVERREALQDLHKEGQKISIQLTDAARKYQDDIDGLKVNDFALTLTEMVNKNSPFAHL